MKPADVEAVLAAVVRAFGFQPAGATVERLRSELAGVGLEPIRVAAVRELAERYGVSRQAVSNWSSPNHRSGVGFPRPVAALAAGAIWDLDETDAWARLTGRRVIEQEESEAA